MNDKNIVDFVKVNLDCLMRGNKITSDEIEEIKNYLNNFKKVESEYKYRITRTFTPRKSITVESNNIQPYLDQFYVVSSVVKIEISKL